MHRRGSGVSSIRTGPPSFTLFAPCCVSTILQFFAVFTVLHFSLRAAFRLFCRFSPFLQFYTFRSRVRFDDFTVFRCLYCFTFFRAVVCFYIFTFFRVYTFSSRGRWYIGSYSFYILTVLHFLLHAIACLVFTFLHLYAFTLFRRPKICFSIFRFYGFRCCCASGLLNCFNNTKILNWPFVHTAAVSSRPLLSFTQWNSQPRSECSERNACHCISKWRWDARQRSSLCVKDPVQYDAHASFCNHFLWFSYIEFCFPFEYEEINCASFSISLSAMQ